VPAHTQIRKSEQERQKRLDAMERQQQEMSEFEVRITEVPICLYVKLTADTK
jgi:hypothetical protein